MANFKWGGWKRNTGMLIRASLSLWTASSISLGRAHARSGATVWVDNLSGWSRWLRGGVRNHPKGATNWNGWRWKSNKKVISESTNKCRSIKQQQVDGSKMGEIQISETWTLSRQGYEFTLSPPSTPAGEVPTRKWIFPAQGAGMEEIS